MPGSAPVAVMSGGRAARRRDHAELLHQAELVDVMPVLRQATVTCAVDIDAVDGELTAGWGHPHERPAVGPDLAPSNDNPVPFRDHVLDREADRIERIQDELGASLQVAATVALARERVVLDVVLDCKLVDYVDVAAVQCLV